MKKRTLGFLLCAALICGLGCQNTAEGMKQDAEINGQKATQAAENAGSKMKETGANVSAAMTLTPAIKAAFDKDAEIKPTIDQIDVDSTDEKVSLNGFVATPAAKIRAEEIAAQILKEHQATQKLVNNLEIKK